MKAREGRGEEILQVPGQLFPYRTWRGPQWSRFHIAADGAPHAGAVGYPENFCPWRTHAGIN